MSKYALEALAEAYRYELSAHGVDSVIVEPGLFRSNLYAALQRPSDRRRTESYGATGGAADALLAGIEAAEPHAHAMLERLGLARFRQQRPAADA
jgi:NAD(P)-dependent dehydrogenase (short-subunit alcohol dehydrogenase family)